MEIWPPGQWSSFPPSFLVFNIKFCKESCIKTEIPIKVDGFIFSKHLLMVCYMLRTRDKTWYVLKEYLSKKIPIKKKTTYEFICFRLNFSLRIPYKVFWAYSSPPLTPPISIPPSWSPNFVLLPAVPRLLFKPIKTKLCYPDTLGYVAFHWTVVNLSGTKPLRKIDLLLPEATNCQ